MRTVRGVRPKRLLATVTEDLWDIYENRVAVRLVDHLLRDVSRRIAKVREVSLEQLRRELLGLRDSRLYGVPVRAQVLRALR